MSSEEISLAQVLITAFAEGYLKAGGDSEKIGESLALSETFDSLSEIPSMMRLEGGVWVWIMRSLVAFEKRVIPLDKNHFVFAVPHNWIPNDIDIQTLRSSVSKAVIQLAGGDTSDLSPTNKNFN